MMKVYCSDPLAALLSTLWPLKSTPIVRQLMEKVAHNHYGMTASLVVQAFQIDCKTSNTNWRAV